MSARFLLGRCLLVLLLVAGASALPGAPGLANAHAPEVGLAQHQASRVQALPPQHGRIGDVAVDAAWADADDDPQPIRFAPAIAAPAATETRPVVLGAVPGITPLSHWPCASTPTGPPAKLSD